MSGDAFNRLQSEPTPLEPAEHDSLGTRVKNAFSGRRGLLLIIGLIAGAGFIHYTVTSPVVRTWVSERANDLRVSMAVPLTSVNDSVPARSQVVLDQLRAKVREADVAGDARVYFDLEECLKRKHGWSPDSSMTNMEMAQVIQRECALEVIGTAFIDTQGGNPRRAARAADLMTQSSLSFRTVPPKPAAVEAAPQALTPLPVAQKPVAAPPPVPPFPPPPPGTAPRLPGAVTVKK